MIVRIANCEEHDQTSSLCWVCTVCRDLLSKPLKIPQMYGTFYIEGPTRRGTVNLEVYQVFVNPLCTTTVIVLRLRTLFFFVLI